MKNKILIIAILAIFGCKAQEVILPLGTNYSEILSDNFYMKDIDNYHDAIVGVWRWENGSDSFEITLQEFEMHQIANDPQEKRDSVFGTYVYIINNEIAVSTNEINPPFVIPIGLYYNSPTEFRIIISDVSTGAYKVGEFTLLNDNTATISLRASEGVKIDYVGSENFSLPTDITLIKQ